MMSALLFFAAVLAGAIASLAGFGVRRRIPENYFRRLVSLLILALGVVMLSGLAK